MRCLWSVAINILFILLNISYFCFILNRKLDLCACFFGYCSSKLFSEYIWYIYFVEAHRKSYDQWNRHHSCCGFFENEGLTSEIKTDGNKGFFFKFLLLSNCIFKLAVVPFSRFSLPKSPVFSEQSIAGTNYNITVENFFLSRAIETRSL